MDTDPWADPPSRSTTPVKQDTQPAADDDGFDDFDDFDDQPADNDGFGDFDDFEGWRALRLRPLPARDELLQQLTDLMERPRADALGDELPRQVGGLGQIMVSDASREAYAQLTTPPMLKTLDWTRSRTRREHLISMGVPVNLDEVDSHRLSSLPPLRINTTSRSVPAPAVPSEKPRYGLGSKPQLDLALAEDLCGIEEGRLSLLGLDKLRAMQQDLVRTSAQASALLAWNLQYKDAQTQDSVTYNGMISELIANAAKAKSAQAAGGVFKRASMRSPIMSPRVGSPAMR